MLAAVSDNAREDRAIRKQGANGWRFAIGSEAMRRRETGNFELKLGLGHEFRDDREAYTQAKWPFVESILERIS